MKKLWSRVRKWLIKKLNAIPGEYQVPAVTRVYTASVRPDTLRVTRRLTVEEMRQLYDENTRRWMTECITRDLKRQIVDAILKSGAIRIQHDEEMAEFRASVMLVRDENRPDWM